MTTKDTKALTNIRHLMASGAAREIRSASGLSLREAGAVVSTSAATIHRWETGKRRPHGQVAVMYARFLESLARQSP